MADGELRESLERVSNRLTELSGAFETAERLEESLEKLDALLDAQLLKLADADDLRAETERSLASYRHKMEPEAYERTRDLMILKKLRERAEIPRLSLFYL